VILGMDRKNRGAQSLFSASLDDSADACIAIIRGSAEDVIGRDKAKKSRGSAAQRSAAVCNDRDDTGSVPLHIAAAHSSTRCMRVLLAHAAHAAAVDIESRWTPMHRALYAGNLGAALLLAAAGARFDDVTEDGILMHRQTYMAGWNTRQLAPCAKAQKHASELDATTASCLVRDREGLTPLDLATLALQPRQQVAAKLLDCCWNAGESERRFQKLGAVSTRALLQPCSIAASSGISCSTAASATPLQCPCGRRRMASPRSGGLCDGCLKASSSSAGNGYTASVSLYSWGKASGHTLGYVTTASRDVVVAPKVVDVGFTPFAPVGGASDLCEGGADAVSHSPVIVAMVASRHHSLLLDSRGCLYAYGVGQGGRLGFTSDQLRRKEGLATGGGVSQRTCEGTVAGASQETPPAATADTALPTVQILPMLIPSLFHCGIRIVQVG
jgi:hypothetical protein